MKNIHIAQLGKPSRQWQAWIKALAGAGFEIKAVNPLAMELQVFRAQPDDIVLLDGMLPNLVRFIQRVCALCPDVQVIVATEVDSFTVKYEVMNLNGAIYVSGPMPGDQFAATVQSIVTRLEVA